MPVDNIALMTYELSNIETITAKALQLKEICVLLCREIDNTKISSLAPTLRNQINTYRAIVEEATEKITENEDLLIRKVQIKQEYQKYNLVINEIEQLKQQEIAISTDYDILLADNKNMVEKVSQIKMNLQLVKKEHDKVVKDLQSHFDENNIICEAMKEEKGIINLIDKYKKEITDMLLKYDTDIKEVIVRGEQLPEHNALDNS